MLLRVEYRYLKYLKGVRKGNWASRVWPCVDSISGLVFSRAPLTAALHIRPAIIYLPSFIIPFLDVTYLKFQLH